MKYRLLAGLTLVLGMVASAFGAVPLQIDRAQSRIDVDVKATTGSFVGLLAKYEAVVMVDPAAKRVLSAEMTFNFNDVLTGDEKRDGHMHAWQETEKYPAGKFVLKTLAPNAEMALIAIGDLTFHGQTHEVSFLVSVLTDAHSVVVDGRVVIDTRDWGLPLIRKFLMLKVDPLVGIDFHLQGDLPVAP